MAGWEARGLCRQRRLQRLGRCVAAPVIRLGRRRALGGSVCVLWEEVCLVMQWRGIGVRGWLCMVAW